MNETVRDKLIEAARNQSIIYYAEVGELLDLFVDNPQHRRELGRILGEISTYEHDSGRPLLSVVVITAPKPSIAF